MGILSDFLRDLSYAPAEAIKRRRAELVDYGYPEYDSTVTNPPPLPEPAPFVDDWQAYDQLAQSYDAEPVVFEQGVVDDGDFGNWQDSPLNGGFMGMEEAYPVEEPFPSMPSGQWDDLSLPSLPEEEQGGDFSNRLMRWNDLFRPEADPYADVVMDPSYIHGDALGEFNNIADLDAPPVADDWQQWDSMPVPSGQEPFNFNLSFEGMDAAIPDRPAVSETDWFGNPKYHEDPTTGEYTEIGNEVMGDDNRSLVDWLSGPINTALEVIDTPFTASKEIGSSLTPLAIDLMSGRAVGDFTDQVPKIWDDIKPFDLPDLGGVGDALGTAGEFLVDSTARNLTPLGKVAPVLNHFDNFGLFKPGTGYDDAMSLVDIGRQSDNPWEYMNRLEEKNEARPLSEQFLGEFVNGANLLGAGLVPANAPRVLRAIDKGADILQGGPVLSAALKGAGRGTGAAWDAIRASHANEVGSGPNMFGWLPDFGGAGDDLSALDIDPLTPDEYSVSSMFDRNSVTPPAAPAVTTPQPRGPLDMAATIQQPPGLMAQGADDIRLTLSPAFDVLPPDPASIKILENVRLHNLNRRDVLDADKVFRGRQFKTSGQAFDEAIASGKTPTEAYIEARQVVSGQNRNAFHETVQLTPEERDAFILRAKNVHDQGGINDPQFLFEVSAALRALDEGATLEPAQAALLEYIVTGVKPSGFAGVRPDMPDTDTLPMFGTDEDFSAKIAKLDNPDSPKSILQSWEPQPNLFRLGSEEAGSPYRVEGDINPLEKSFPPPRVDESTGQVPLLLEYGSESFQPGVTPQGEFHQLPRVDESTGQIPIVIPYGADSFVPGVTPQGPLASGLDLPPGPIADVSGQLPMLKNIEPVGPATNVTPLATPALGTSGLGYSDLPAIDPGTDISPTRFTETFGPYKTEQRELVANNPEYGRKVQSVIDQWERNNLPVFDSIAPTAGTSRLSRIANGGDLPSRLANTLTLRGRELSQALQNSGMSEEAAIFKTKEKIGSYMDRRFLDALIAGDTDGAVRQAYTALNMGDFSDLRFSRSLENAGQLPIGDVVDYKAAFIADREAGLIPRLVTSETGSQIPISGVEDLKEHAPEAYRAFRDRHQSDVSKVAFIADREAGLIPHSITNLEDLKRDAPEVYRAFRDRHQSDVGKVPDWVRAAERVSSKAKNMKFGFLDFNALISNALPAVQGGFPGLAAKVLNEMAQAAGKGIDFDAIVPNPELVGLNMRPKGMELNPEVGTLIGGLGEVAQRLGADKVGSALKAVDRQLIKYNEFLTDIQYNKILGGQRKAIFEGNLVIMKLAGKDIADPAVQRVAAEMANSVTSAANLATRNGRRAVENTGLTSASFLRAQGELLKSLTDIVTGGSTTQNATLAGKIMSPERIMAATTLASMGAAIYGANALAGGYVDLDPSKPSTFGTLTIPNPLGANKRLKIQLFPQKQLARGFAESFNAVKDMDPGELTKTWAEFFLGRAAPIPGTAANMLGYGFDPDREQYAWGDWGSGMTSVEKLLSFSQLPSGLDRMIDTAKGKDSLASLIAGVAGAQAYDESDLEFAIYEDVSTGLLPNTVKKYADIKADPVLAREFNLRHPEAWESSDASDAIQEYRGQKESITGGFETGKSTVGDWRDAIRQRNDNIAGVFLSNGIEGNDPENHAQSRIFDFNKTFDEATNPDGSMDYDKLDRLQAEFYAKYNTPEDRVQVVKYQLAGASGIAEAQRIKDQVRLHGYDPDTGQRLTFGNGKPYPDYYELKTTNRYVHTVIDNEAMRDYVDRFEEWRGRTNPPGERASQLALYLSTEGKTAPDGKAWDAARLNDLNNYGKESKETAEFQAYKNTFKSWVIWDKQDAYWSEIERLKNESNEKGFYIGPQK